MKREFPSLLDLHFTPGTFGSHAVMSIESDNAGEIRRAITMALSFPNIKKAVMVNEDVDPSDPLEVEWAMATRFQADRDLIVIPSLRGQAIDPSSGPGFETAKVGIDATRPDQHGFEKISFPERALGTDI
jgi:2,5-furandicarboxylate decarboxylase 1